MKNLFWMWMLCCLSGVLSASESVILLEQAKRYSTRLGVSEIQDSLSDNGKAYAFDGRHGGWSISFSPASVVKPALRKCEWIVLARLRADASVDHGPAFYMGLYSYKDKRDIFKRRIDVSEIKGTQYRTILIGTATDIDAEIWAGGPSRAEGVKTVYLDQIKLVRKMTIPLPKKFLNRKIQVLDHFKFDAKRCTHVLDAAQSGTAAVRVRGDSPSWSLHLTLTDEEKKAVCDGSIWESYVELRAEGEASVGAAFEFGLYDNKLRKHVLSKRIPMEYIKGQSYQLVKIGESRLDKTCYFWGGALKRKQVEAIYIRRLILVKQLQE